MRLWTTLLNEKMKLSKGRAVSDDDNRSMEQEVFIYANINKIRQKKTKQLGC